MNEKHNKLLYSAYILPVFNFVNFVNLELFAKV